MKVWVDHMQMMKWSPLHYIKQRPAHANGLSAIVALVIIILSLTPLPELPDVPGNDKTHHIIAYATLALPTALALPRRVWLMALVYIALGGLIETFQPYVNRYGEWLDFIANVLGVILGSLVGVCANKLID